MRPILFDACISCHGPDSASRKADLRLDKREAAIDLGAIAPGDPKSSEMIRRILSEDDDERMPPPESKKVLSNDQKQTLVRWIAEGAAYQPLWSFTAPQRPGLPEVKQAAWVRNPIDRFILAHLEAANLTPAVEADRRTLARRVCLDLTGLPPSPELLDDFLADDSPDAYDRLVDRLLASPRWGEHRARYWLDAARYADTHGIHIDNFREMWSYRDWVIKAFNANMRFDEFTVENLAGDLLPDASLDQEIASGFNRCNITTSEGGAIDEEYAVLYTRDRTETASQVWLGLTAGCAVCHDHKFDPLTQREFYELAAFFNNTTQKPMDGNVKDTPPIVHVPLESDRERWKELASLVPAAEQAVDAYKQEARPQFDKWLAHATPKDVEQWIPTADLQLAVPLDDDADVLHYVLNGESQTTPTPSTLEWRPGKARKASAYLNQGGILELPEAGDFEGDQPYSVAAWVKLPANDSSASIIARMDDQHDYRGWDFWIEGRRVGGHVIHKWPDNAIKAVTSEQLTADQWLHIAIIYDGSRKAAGLKIYVNGVSQPTNVTADSLSETIRTTVPLKIGQRHSSSQISGVQLEDIRIYSRAIAESEMNSLANAAVFANVRAAPPEARSAADLDALFSWWFAKGDDKALALIAQRDSLLRERTDIEARGTIAHVMHERSDPAVAFILNRGEYDQRLDQVAPATPAFLPPFPGDEPRNRLGFARWLLRDDNPLTARVTVNRWWQEVFGQGLVRTVGDFGASGELPSHLELLDWLAVEFRESRWNVKQFYKLLVTSSAYRQSAASTPEKIERDPDNRLLSRAPRFRMDAEMVRDYALAASGALVPRIGGPSVKPYQPPGVWEAVAMTGSNTRDYRQDAGDALHRRSLYTFWKRSAPPASMDIFNAPSRERCTMIRERTNTPLQALVTLNDPQFIEAARQLAQRAIHDAGPQSEARIALIAKRLLARELSAEEMAIVRESIEKLTAQYTNDPDGAKSLIEVGESRSDGTIPVTELAAWTMVANQLMNLDEVLNK